MDGLENVFESFAAGPEMDNRAFTKCLKDCGMLKGGTTTTDADLIFAKVKPKGERKIQFSAFLQGLEEIAKKKKCPVEAIVQQIVATDGPILSGTKVASGRGAQNFNDESTFTGTHKQGGPTTAGTGVAIGGYSNLQGLISRDVTQDDAINRKAGRVTAADAKAAARKGGYPAPADAGGYPAPANAGGYPAPADNEEKQRKNSAAGLALLSGVLEGAPDSPSKQLESEPAAKTMPRAKPKAAGGTNMPRGPERFFYDKSSYTGVHNAGGPSTNDRGTDDLSQMTRKNLERGGQTRLR